MSASHETWMLDEALAWSEVRSLVRAYRATGEVCKSGFYRCGTSAGDFSESELSDKNNIESMGLKEFGFV